MEYDPWHYPRGKLADHILQALTVVDLIAIFAPRRKGKTWFVLRDLSPACINRDYVPVYASLWRTPGKPHVAVIEALNLANETLKKKRIPWKEYLNKLASVSVNVAGLGGGSIGLATKHKASSSDLVEIGRLMEEAVNAAQAKKRQVLLLIDEAQHLATSDVFDPMTKSMRTAIEGMRATEPGALKAVFTGSSRTDLTALLEHRNAAFYGSFDRQELPDLDREYTDFVAAQLDRLGDIKVDREELWEAFTELHRSPYYMQEIIRELMLRRASTLNDAYNIVIRALRENPEIEARWLALDSLEQAVFKRMNKGASIYSADALEALAGELDENRISTSQVQNAVRLLVRNGYIDRTSERGSYRIEDPELVTWLEQRE